MTLLPIIIYTYLYALIHMRTGSGKPRLNITIDKEVLEKARKMADEKHISLSGLIENFLDFFVDSKVYCFKCGERFSSSDSSLCPKCGWMKCPRCEVCRCDLDDDVAEAVFHMRRVYEDLLIGRVKPD